MSEKIFSLKELEQTFNIKAQTLRTWEKRYGLVCPKRNNSNIRCYSQEEKELLSYILLLKDHGYKLRHLANWDVAKIKMNAVKLIQAEKLIDKWLEDILEATFNFNSKKIEYIFKQAANHYSEDCLVLKVILPLFEQFNVLWLTGSVNSLHERFLGQVVCNKLIYLTEKLKQTTAHKGKEVVLVSSDGVQKEYLLRIIQYLLHKQHFQVTYLGCSISTKDIKSLNDKIKTGEWLFLIAEELINMSLVQYVNHLKTILASHKIDIIAHPKSRENELVQEVTIHQGIPEYIKFLKESCNN